MSKQKNYTKVELSVTKAATITRITKKSFGGRVFAGGKTVCRLSFALMFVFLTDNSCTRCPWQGHGGVSGDDEHVRQDGANSSFENALERNFSSPRHGAFNRLTRVLLSTIIATITRVRHRLRNNIVRTMNKQGTTYGAIFYLSSWRKLVFQ